MKKPKEFKTFEEQIEILKSRGLIITDEQKAIEILKKENYYNIVNGYKDLFLKSNSIDKELFIDNTHFDELYSLFLFDRELRTILLKYILLFERDFKTALAYNFSKKYNKNNRIDSYLYPENYRDDYIDVLNFISSINNLIVLKSEKTNYIKHYIENYGHIPLWVVVNIMSFGNMAFMFKILKDVDKNKIILIYVNRYKNQNSRTNNIRIRNDSFLSLLKVLNIVRNTCAHEERIYSITFDRASTRDVSNLIEYNSYDDTKLIIVFMFLKMVLSRENFCSLKEEMIKFFDKFSNKFQTVSFDHILEKMGIKLKDFYQL
ncbi:hypothetical protein MFERI14815_00664 [Mycoplasma feriruminatoris]|uniref:Membrane protein n=1 Tax=Mycoplasma feriruminatoris TaxID=1179777 RepID=A0AAQ3HX35_9MOLU|nr:Abi family protein [Mycoplasma feriruminatoris]WFQ92048.1 hypothetical protein MFERI14815_00664 [Mycoplasma feriruminatoris]WFQ93737.1 membrane protein [Mycoplasma feriruminatoris]WFQ95399.1 membrane protein [Mycoplasma feriruminatoris]